MARGLPVRPFPVFLAGGLDTKTDPRLVPAGSMLEVENMFYQRTGELRLRNGFATLTGAALVTEISSLFSSVAGDPMLLGKTAVIQGSENYLNVRKFATGVGWRNTHILATPYPSVTATRIGGSSSKTVTGGAAPNPVDGDVSSNGTTEIQTWLDQNTGGGFFPQHFLTRNGSTMVDDNSLQGDQVNPPISVSGTASNCAVSVNNGTATIVVTKSTPGSQTPLNVGVGTVDTAACWVDARQIPGTDTFFLAYKLTAAGGVAVAVINMTTMAITTGPTTIAAADATQCLGLLLDKDATTSAYLVTAGATSGVVQRTITISTLAITATNVIDASATANVRQVTGHTNGSATNLFVYWDVNNATQYYSLVKRASSVAGVTTIRSFLFGVSLYSRTFKANDGRMYVLAAYSSATQPTYILFHAEQQYSAGGSPTQNPLCVIFAGNALGRRSNPSSLTGSYIDSLGRTILCAGRKSSAAAQTQERIALEFGAPIKTRELGGLVLGSGGIVMSHDGVDTKWATTIMYLEPVAAVPAAGGSMTLLSTYSYVAVIADNDAQGNRVRSAKSVPISVLLTGANQSMTLTLQNPRTAPRYNEDQTIEIYRAGPAETGATGYNKVGEVYTNPTFAGADTISFTDTMADATAYTGETLYSTGNVLENFVTPSTKLLEVCNQRAWIVSAETPDELWPSKEFKPGQGVNFNPLLAFRVTGDGYGAITALAAQDGQLIVFKSSAIYAITGQGPNDLGQGTFNTPRVVSLSNGTTVPGSVVATPNGVLFQSTKGGIWMLDRGFGLSYVGQAVESFTTGATVIGASLVNGTTQARFVLANGRCLVFDYGKPTATIPGTWTTFLLRVAGSTVVACADIPAGWCYACADGRVYQETAGVYSDVNSISTIAIVPAVTFPILATAGINGFARLYAVEILGEYVGDHTLIATLTTGDYGLVSATSQQFVVTAATAASGYQWEVKPANQKGAAYRLRLTATLAAGSGAFRLSAITLLAAMKTGSNVPFTKRLA